MKKYKLIVRQRIINPRTKMVHDDEGLKALDGYRESLVYTFPDDTDPETVLSNLIEEYERSPEAMPNCEYELKAL